jgi:hypothetical protein
MLVYDIFRMLSDDMHFKKGCRDKKTDCQVTINDNTIESRRARKSAAVARETSVSWLIRYA